jgi:peptidyl-prolyl cis-trans isomerase A (cyclophilin A)
MTEIRLHETGGTGMSRIGLSIAAISVLLALALVVPGFAQKKTVATKSVVEFDTTMGSIKVELYPAKAPITTRNFLDYVNSGFYNGTIVHRVDFVIGLGGYTETMMPKSARPPIKNESKNGLKNLRGTLAMARYDNPDSATSQFFINLKDNSHLDPAGAGFGYAVFGKVIEGMDVVDKISKVKTGTKAPFSNIPLQTIAVKSAKVVSK